VESVWSDDCGLRHGIASNRIVKRGKGEGGRARNDWGAVSDFVTAAFRVPLGPGRLASARIVVGWRLENLASR